MPKLKCNVEQCAYNSNRLCSKNYIDVDGPEAFKKSETSCRSYLYKDVDTDNVEFASFDNVPSLQTEVYCDATQCVYEKGQRCYADKIEICNVKSNDITYKTANNKTITECHTFEPHD